MTTQIAPNPSEDPVLIEVHNRKGWITLNRDKSLNSLNMEMIHLIHRTLEAWASDSDIQAVILQGNGRAFCAGGDVRNFYYNKQKGKLDESIQFFEDEYKLNTYIKNYPKPYISLINGINMGGGLGISIHGSHRIVTENAIMAMPEATIGFHTDVGGSYFLSRLPNNWGTYLGLTGDHIMAEDALYLGLATHHVPSSKLNQVIEKLTNENLSSTTAVDKVIEGVSKVSPNSILASHQGVVSQCFGGETVESILENLEKEGSPFAQETLKNLNKKSPTSLKVVLRSLQKAKTLSFEDCMAQELTLSKAFVNNHDFEEGVRALLIDKDHNPKWNPSSLAGVTQSQVDRYF